MTTVPSNLIPTRISELPEYPGSSGLGYVPYVINGVTYKAQVTQIVQSINVPPSRLIVAGGGLTGGGTLAADINLSIAPGGVGAGQLDLTGVIAGTYGAAASVPVFTVDANGRISSASNVPAAVPVINLTDPANTQGALPLGRGGTGNVLSPVAGAVVYTDGARMQLTGTGVDGQVLTWVSGVPMWVNPTGGGGGGGVSLVAASGGTTGMSFTGSPITSSGTFTLTGTLNVANGGTGATTAAAARTNLGVTATGADTTYAFRANNLSDLANLATARTNLGVTATGADTTYAFRANNLSDLANPATARSNLGAAPTASPTFTGTVTLPSTTGIGTVTATEISYLSGVTSAIQTQLNAKAPLASPTFTGTVTIATLALTNALTAANGGTGLTSPGASGNVLTSNGTSWVSSPPAASGVSQARATALALVFRR